MASRSDWTADFSGSEVIPNAQTADILSQAWGGSASAQQSASYASGIFGTTGYSSSAQVLDYATLYSAEGQEALSSIGLDFSSYFQGDDFFSQAGFATAWTFITAPEQISWVTNAQVDRQRIFGTNAPPVVVGSRGMRDLTISNALVEGFSRLKSVESKIIDLENLQNFSLNGQSGYVQVPVYQVWANSKKYGYANGADGGYFVIESIDVKETMRDLAGNATRAYVDIKLTQVPAYQVDSGADLASQQQAGASSILPAIDNLNQGVGTSTNPVSGALAPKPAGSGSTSTSTSTTTAPRPGGLDALDVRRPPTPGL